ncbi:hypothetical protein OROMI_013291 [Orobanche minor]
MMDRLGHEGLLVDDNGLHEDLNRVKCKPYVEAKDSDEEVAEEYWWNHLARNDSIIIDVCQLLMETSCFCTLGAQSHDICRFLSVLWFLYPSLVGNAIVRTEGLEDRYSILIRLDDQNSADLFYKHFNGRYFSSLEEETCHMFFTIDIQYTGSVELSQSSPGSSAEQPSCPVCLGLVPSQISMPDCRNVSVCYLF